MQGDSTGMGAVHGAVFLSYASEDAAAAARIAAALRAAGLEIWLDQSELRGGDAWDRQIRSRIHDCRLFIAVISASTEARDEGYFRREWKLAVDRTHDMSEKKTFLLPVVIDQTSERLATVPDKFREVTQAIAGRFRRLPVCDDLRAVGGDVPGARVARNRAARAGSRGHVGEERSLPGSTAQRAALRGGGAGAQVPRLSGTRQRERPIMT